MRAIANADAVYSFNMQAAQWRRFRRGLRTPSHDIQHQCGILADSTSFMGVREQRRRARMQCVLKVQLKVYKFAFNETASALSYEVPQAPYLDFGPHKCKYLAPPPLQ